VKETIAAISTAFGEAGVGIVRISGSKAAEIADRVLRYRQGQPVNELEFSKRESNRQQPEEQRPGMPDRPGIRQWPSHSLHLAEVWDPQKTEKIDEVLVAVMWAPRSYTGEDVVELQGHGGRFVIQEVLQAVLKAGARLAEPGEFTKRAFLNGRMDLVQAEAVIDLIKARSEESRRLALRQLEGRLSSEIKDLQEKLVGIIAGMEAVMDFPEEGIISDDNESAELKKVLKEVERILEGAKAGRAIREGIKVVIIGKPNVGKSSLWNTLIGEDRAIVTDIPGTTRDSLEEEVVVRGIPLRLIDTAGIRETMDRVEQIGVEKTREMLKRGQLVVVIFDAGEGIGAEDKKVVELISGLSTLIVINKTDLAQQRISAAEIAEILPGETVIWTSMKEKRGIDELKEAILTKVLGSIEAAGEEWLVSSIRQEEAIRGCLYAGQTALGALEAGLPAECVLIDLYEALDYLGQITGESVSEQVLDRIFAEFCIGK
jgi:tRNA modification GTPase